MLRFFFCLSLVGFLPSERRVRSTPNRKRGIYPRLMHPARPSEEGRRFSFTKKKPFSLSSRLNALPYSPARRRAAERGLGAEARKPRLHRATDWDASSIHPVYSRLVFPATSYRPRPMNRVDQLPSRQRAQLSRSRPYPRLCSSSSVAGCVCLIRRFKYYR